ncbi:CPBP family intramembrane glutamic endopeptidase [Candidatus Leptofilum sp.]|uniref:CPBP family intramembrane glutamic endopeptidase n=1 Tax=Candidatus Leptofilum sp. TaxID=3241576 RepID=UPI003B5AA0BD
MKKFKQFANSYPLAFVFMMIVLLLLLMGGGAAAAVGLLGFAMTDVMPQIIGQLVATLGFLLILWHFDWLKPAGILHLGSRRIWFITLILLIYTGLVLLYAFFGTLRVDLSLRPKMAPALIHTTLAGVMEEILLRGLVLYALVSRWGHKRRGVVTAVLVSALLFGALHFFNLATGEWNITALQVLEAFVSAILYGGLVLVGGSVWPAVVLHSGINLLANIAALNNPRFAMTASIYWTFILLELPTVIYGGYLLAKVSLNFSDRPARVATTML